MSGKKLITSFSIFNETDCDGRLTHGFNHRWIHDRYTS